VAAVDRVATFDNDGTLWNESPVFVQACFLRQRVATMVEGAPALARDPAFAAVLERDEAALHALGKQKLVELVMRTHTGMRSEAFDAIAREWFATARHPVFDRPFTACVYRPMRQLLDFLRAHAFAVYIVTGGGVDFVRAISEEAYGVSRSNVIGSRARSRFVERGGESMIEKLPELASFDDGDAKPENIHDHVGRRPILAFGNSDGDLAMLSYATRAAGRRAGLLLHHDDGERERAYDRDFLLSPLRRGLEVAHDQGWHVVSIKRDFARVF
jgi:phosphoserine phosphatase